MMRNPRLAIVLILAASGAAACGWPMRAAFLLEPRGQVVPIEGFEDVRAVDGYPSAAFQKSFDEVAEKAAERVARHDPAEGKPRVNMLVLSSGGVNGAFGAGILTEWTVRGDRPDFDIVTGVSVGALMAPFAYAGPAFDARVEGLFRRLDPSDLHHEKGVLASVMWDESLMDNRSLRQRIASGIDLPLVEAMAARHEAGARCYVGSTNLDMGEFVVWDLGAIATRRSEAAVELIRKVLTASASIPVVYPPVRFDHGDRGELHVDGAVMRSLFLPELLYDCHAAAAKAGIDWQDFDVTAYVIHNGSLRSRPDEVQRDTLGIATRTVTMMSYTMVADHVLHLFMLTRVWGANFRFLTMPDGLELDINSFTADDTERLYLLGQGMIREQEPWQDRPPGYVANDEIRALAVRGSSLGAGVVTPEGSGALARIEQELKALRAEVRELRERR
ncbi:MAG: patatin-like phospholipase family protein [Planctomycetes bacterium]|nr:patatin-like phospholipase family protein [Planctomycetota bacterium]